MDITQFLQGSFLISGGLFAFIWGINCYFSNSTRTMSYILWISALWLFAGAYIFTKIHLIYPYFYGLHLPFVYLAGPFFYLYYKKNILEDNLEKFYLHLIPSILVFIAILPFQFWSTTEQILFLESTLNKKMNSYSYLLGGINFFTKIFLLGYMSIILYQNRNIFHSTKEISDKSRIQFLFMTSLLYLDLFIGLIGFFLQSFSLVKLSALLLPINLYIFYLFSSKYPEMLSGIKREMKKVRYEQSKIKNLDINTILEKIKSIMEKEKAFTDEDISLSGFAEELEISSHQLSQLLNEKLNQTFPQFINEYRITEAKKIMLEEKKRPVLSIAFAVGFNSKASFNRAFKQITGITPQQFRKNYS
ncbi:MAG: AraC family transcriptional regulator [Leptospiraceae bacterium]|nr:AraC family transcriptional regulator [Leptospiraceae bacterium]